MSKVRLYHDEWWPMVVEVDDLEWGAEYDVPDDLLVEWREAEKRYLSAHEKVKTIYEDTNKERYVNQRTSP